MNTTTVFILDVNLLGSLLGREMQQSASDYGLKIKTIYPHPKFLNIQNIDHLYFIFNI